MTSGGQEDLARADDLFRRGMEDLSSYRLEQAREAFAGAQELFEGLRLSKGVDYCLRGQGFACSQEGRYAEAEEHFARARDLLVARSRGCRRGSHRGRPDEPRGVRGGMGRGDLRNRRLLGRLGRGARGPRDHHQDKRAACARLGETGGAVVVPLADDAPWAGPEYDRFWGALWLGVHGSVTTGMDTCLIGEVSLVRLSLLFEPGGVDTYFSGLSGLEEKAGSPSTRDSRGR